MHWDWLPLDQVLRALRAEFVLTQEVIAASTGASVRSVRNWESGQRPRSPFGARLRQLAAVTQLVRQLDEVDAQRWLMTVNDALGRRPADLLSEDRGSVVLELLDRLIGAGPTPPPRRRGQRSRPEGRVRTGARVDAPRRRLLPLGDLEWEPFEDFCLQLLGSLPEIREAHRYGGAGSKQRGIDLFADTVDGRRFTYQCKQIKRCDAGTVRGVVQKHDRPGDHHHLLVSPRASTPARDEADLHPDWSLLDTTDIALLVRRLPPWAARSLLDSFFGPALRREFLGSAGAGTFLPGRDLLAAYLNPNRLFHHRNRLVGREGVLATLVEIAGEPLSTRAVLLPGQGGSGKTRLILELERRLREHHDREVLWLASEAPLTPDMLDELPPAPMVLVVDDAHRRSNLDALLQVVLRRSLEWPTLLVLMTRPQGTRPLRVQLGQTGWDDSAIIQLDALEPLSDEDAAELACVAIGEEGSQSKSLARASEGLPLLTTVGGSLIAQDKLDAGQALTDRRFRETVLDRWSDEVVGKVGLVDPAIVKRLLPVLAAISPVRETDAALLDQIARFVGCAEPIAEYLAAIEDAGLLSRHGSLLRVVPDVLADHLVATAAVSSRGLDTGLCRRLFEEFANVALPAIVRTLAELDWRLRLQGSKVDPLADAWEWIRSTLQAGDAPKRRDLLRVLAPIAAFQPQRILDLVQWCIDNPAEPNSDWSALGHVVTHDQVLEALPPLLRGCAYHLDLLPRALDLLWRLGRDDMRAENQNPDHGLRILRDIAAYEVGKPLDVQQAMLEAAGRWLLDGPTSGAAGVTPLAIVRPLVALECVSTRWTRMRVTLRSFPLLPEQIRSTRNAALEVAFAHLDASSLEVAADALVLIKDALRAWPDIPGDEDRWDGERAQLVDRLRAELPRISYRLVPMVRSAVRWHLRHRRDSAVGLAARRLLDALPNDPRASLVSVLVGDLDDFEDDSVIDEDATERWDRRDQRRREFVRTVASEVIMRTDGPAEVCKLLDDEVADLERAGGYVGGLGELLSAIVEADPVSGAEVVLLASTGSELLSRQLGGAIAVLVERDHERALRVARRIMEDGSAEAVLALAFAWSFAPWIGGNLDDAAVEILKQLLRWDDWRVRNHAARAIRAVWQADHARGCHLIRIVELRGEAEVADEVCEVLMHPGGRFLDALGEEDLDHLIDQFAELGTLDHHWIREFLETLGSRRLLKLTSLFLDRIEKASDVGLQATDRDRKYTPLPYDFGRPGQLGDLAGHPDLGDALRLVRDRTLRRSTLPEWWAPYLFGGLSDSWGPVALAVLAEYIASGDAELISGASHLIREASSGFIFSNLPWVEDLIEASVAASSACAASVRSDLLHTLRSRSGSRVPGRPDTSMVHLRVEASAALEQVRSPHMRAFLMAVADYADSTIDDDLRRDEELFSRHRG